MAAEFDLLVEQAGFSDAASAEQRYLGEHTRIASKLPGLRYYLVGRLVAAAGREPDRARFALLAFDNADALREAYRSAGWRCFEPGWRSDDRERPLLSHRRDCPDLRLELSQSKHDGNALMRPVRGRWLRRAVAPWTSPACC